MTRWWRGVSLRAKVTGVTVGLIAIALIAAGIGTFVFVRGALIGYQDEQLIARASNDYGAGVFRVDADPVSGQLSNLTLTDSVTTYAVAIYDIEGNLVTSASASEVAPRWPEEFPYERTVIGGTATFELVNDDGEYFHASAGPLDIVPGRLFTQVIAMPLAPLDRTLQTFMGIYGLFAGVAIAAAAVTTRLLVTRTFRPLGQVETAAQAIAGGDFSMRLAPGDPRTEVGKLTNAINTMLDRVDRSLDEREATVKQMRRFIGDASHELRTPLVTVRGYAELYRLGAITGEGDTAQAMERIEKEAIRMGIMVEDLLALARLDERRDVTIEPIDLRAIARDAAMDVRAAAPGRVVTVIDETAGGTDASAPGDADAPAPDGAATDGAAADGGVPGRAGSALPAAPAATRSADAARRRATGAPSLATGALALLRRRPRPRAGEPSGHGGATDRTRERAPQLPPVVLGEENRIRQVVANLLGNARRFSPEDSPIEIAVGTDPARRSERAPRGMGWIAIVDHGEGIPPQIRSHIFERFWRADTSRARETGGTGLGLAIVASIVEALQGAVDVDDSPGGGATFRVWFPLAPEATLHLDTQPLPRLDGIAAPADPAAR